MVKVVLGYHEIADQLRAEVLSGKYPPGTYLPEQRLLAALYGRNIGTIRRAVAVLNTEGLLDPVRGRGTRVRPRTLLPLTLRRYNDPDSTHGPWETACAATGVTGHTAITAVTTIPADELIAEQLKLRVGAPIVRRDNEMSAAGVVLQLQSTYIPRGIAGDGPFIERAGIQGGIYAGLRRGGYAPTEVEETVTSRMPTPHEAKQLKLRAGSPVLVARRTTHDQDGTPLVHTHVVVSALEVALVYRQTL